MFVKSRNLSSVLRLILDIVRLMRETPLIRHKTLKIRGVKVYCRDPAKIHTVAEKMTEMFDSCMRKG